MNKKIYISTPIYYPNSKLHLGHAYTNVLADYLARYKKLCGYDVYFSTGSDEHGQKIADLAALAKKSPLVYVTEIVESFKELWAKLGIEYTHFVRTTDQEHQLFVQTICDKLFAKKDIYKGFYKDWYCKNDEAYFTSTQLTANHQCPLCNREVVEIEEESYFLKTSKFQEWIKDALTEDNILLPKVRQNELLKNFLTELKDLSISRISLEWGIPLPFDNKHTLYVWVDALLNYLSTFTYSKANWTVEEVWKTNSKVEICQFVGKEITRFHAIYWPIILKMLNYRKPFVFAHGWIIGADGDKMSKSKGNAFDPIYLIDKYSADALRFYLINNIPNGEDGRFSEKLLIENINGLLVNKLANLVSRTNGMLAKYFNSVVPKGNENDKQRKKTKKLLTAILVDYHLAMKELNFSASTKLLLNYIDQINLYIEQTIPWKQSGLELATILNFLITEIANLAICFSPILTQTSEKLFNWLGIKKVVSYSDLDRNFTGQKLANLDHLFERIKS